MRNLIGQFAVVDRSTDNAARVNVSRNGHALKESSVYSVDVDIVVKENRQWFGVTCTLVNNNIRNHSGKICYRLTRLAAPRESTTF